MLKQKWVPLKRIFLLSSSMRRPSLQRAGLLLFWFFFLFKTLSLSSSFPVTQLDTAQILVKLSNQCISFPFESNASRSSCIGAKSSLDAWKCWQRDFKGRKPLDRWFQHVLFIWWNVLPSYLCLYPQIDAIIKLNIFL